MCALEFGCCTKNKWIVTQCGCKKLRHSQLHLAWAGDLSLGHSLLDSPLLFDHTHHGPQSLHKDIHHGPITLHLTIHFHLLQVNLQRDVHLKDLGFTVEFVHSCPSNQFEFAFKVIRVHFTLRFPSGPLHFARLFFGFEVSLGSQVNSNVVVA